MERPPSARHPLRQVTLRSPPAARAARQSSPRVVSLSWPCVSARAHDVMYDAAHRFRLRSPSSNVYLHATVPDRGAHAPPLRTGSHCLCTYVRIVTPSGSVDVRQRARVWTRTVAATARRRIPQRRHPPQWRARSPDATVSRASRGSEPRRTGKPRGTPTHPSPPARRAAAAAAAPRPSPQATVSASSSTARRARARRTLAEEQLDPLAADLAPGPRERRQAADQPVDLGRRPRPVDPRLGLVDLRGIGDPRLGLRLRRQAVEPRQRLDDQPRPEPRQPVVQRAGGVPRADRQPPRAAAPARCRAPPPSP